MKKGFFYFKVFLYVFLFTILTVPLWAPYAIEALLESSFVKQNQEIFSEQAYEQQDVAVSEPEVHKMKVLATAYYKPEKFQSFYAHGSYDKDVSVNGNGINFIENEAKVGTAAADPSVIPLGSVIYVPGYGRAIIEDIGGDIKNKRIDLFMGDGEEALRKALTWGKKEVTITILEWGE